MPTDGAVAFSLEKRIPMGAGLGGGSSDAVAALRALNAASGPRWALPPDALAAVAAGLGSDCPLFLQAGRHPSPMFGTVTKMPAARRGDSGADAQLTPLSCLLGHTFILFLFVGLPSELYQNRGYA